VVNSLPEMSMTPVGVLVVTLALVPVGEKNDRPMRRKILTKLTSAFITAKGPAQCG